MKKIFKIIVIALCYHINAQKVEPVKVTIEKGIPGESFSKTALGLEFWVQDKDKLIAFNKQESKVLVLKTAAGEGLLQRHKKAVEERKNYVKEQAKKSRYLFSSRGESIIDFKNSRPLRDTLGFKVILDSWVIPLKKASGIHFKANIAYYIVDKGAKTQSTITKNIVLKKTKELLVNGKKLPLKENGYGSSGGVKSLYYEISSEELGGLIHKIEQVNAKGEVIEDVFSNNFSGKIRFQIKENKANTPIHLKFTIKPLLKKSVVIEETVSLGL